MNELGFRRVENDTRARADFIAEGDVDGHCRRIGEFIRPVGVNPFGQERGEAIFD